MSNLYRFSLILQVYRCIRESYWLFKHFASDLLKSQIWQPVRKSFLHLLIVPSLQTLLSVPLAPQSACVRGLEIFFVKIADFWESKFRLKSEGIERKSHTEISDFKSNIICAGMSIRFLPLSFCLLYCTSKHFFHSYYFDFSENYSRDSYSGGK